MKKASKHFHTQQLYRDKVEYHQEEASYNVGVLVITLIAAIFFIFYHLFGVAYTPNLEKGLNKPNDNLIYIKKIE